VLLWRWRRRQQMRRNGAAGQASDNHARAGSIRISWSGRELALTPRELMVAAAERLPWTAAAAKHRYQLQVCVCVTVCDFSG
jgi:hypothetical protein